jgi:hypothetical protein
LTNAAIAQELDVKAPLECSVEQGYDCLPAQSQCTSLQSKPDGAPVFKIDFTKQEIRSPFRTDVLRVSHTTTNKESFILQGTDLLFAFSALINKATGALTVSIADRKGAYVVFGQCKVARNT